MDAYQSGTFGYLRAFIGQHADQFLAVDSFVVDTRLADSALYVLFLIEIGSRRISPRRPHLPSGLEAP